MPYVLDTNIISEIMKDNHKVKIKIQKKLLEGCDIFINAISYYEIKRGLLHKNAYSKLKLFVSQWEEFGFLLFDDKEIFDIAAVIWASAKKRGKTVNDADILIASAVKNKDYTLVTHDKHFNNIPGVKKEDWVDESKE